MTSISIFCKIDKLDLDYLDNHIFNKFDDYIRFCEDIIDYCDDVNLPVHKINFTDFSGLIEEAKKSIINMYYEYSESMKEIFNDVKIYREISLSHKFKHNITIDTISYKDELCRMYKFIMKNTEYKTLKKEAKKIFKSFLIWYKYSESCLKYYKYHIKQLFEKDNLDNKIISSINEKLNLKLEAI